MCILSSLCTRCQTSWYKSRFFFFQAEDGIRDYKVTGVQTCALPISHRVRIAAQAGFLRSAWRAVGRSGSQTREEKLRVARRRSEERRVGKECRSRWSPYH